MTGYESKYLKTLMEPDNEIVVVLQKGDQITGQLIWYDHGCLKVTPADGSPSLLIPKTSIKYIYESSVAAES